MIYLPSQSFRWWICPKLGVERPSRYYKRIGWWNEDIRQTTFEEYLEINAYQFLRGMVELIPLESRVLDALSRGPKSQRLLEQITCAYWQDMDVKRDCTMKTALNRLVKRGLITRKLYSRGWFRWYEYRKADDNETR